MPVNLKFSQLELPKNILHTFLVMKSIIIAIICFNIPGRKSFISRSCKTCTQRCHDYQVNCICGGGGGADGKQVSNQVNQIWRKFGKIATFPGDDCKCKWQTSLL